MGSGAAWPSEMTREWTGAGLTGCVEGRWPPSAVWRSGVSDPFLCREQGPQGWARALPPLPWARLPRSRSQKWPRPALARCLPLCLLLLSRMCSCHSVVFTNARDQNQTSAVTRSRAGRWAHGLGEQTPRPTALPGLEADRSCCSGVRRRRGASGRVLGRAARDACWRLGVLLLESESLQVQLCLSYKRGGGLPLD